MTTGMAIAIVGIIWLMIGSRGFRYAVFLTFGGIGFLIAAWILYFANNPPPNPNHCADPGHLHEEGHQYDCVRGYKP